MQIDVKNIEYVFLKKTPIAHKALKNVSVSISQGEYIGIIGQTGSGKTTFIEHLNGLLIPSSGEIKWQFIDQRKVKVKEQYYDKKHNLKTKKTKAVEEYLETFILRNTWRKKVKKAKAIRKHIGIIFQFAEYQLFEETIEKDIAFGPRSFGISKQEAKERAKKYLNLVGMDESYLKKSPFELSGGQKRRVALAGILAMEPDVLIADEPTAGLDPAGVKEILNIFNELHKMGKTIVIVTHDLDNVLEVTERTLIFKDGEIIKDGPTYEVLKDTAFLEANEMQPPKLLAFVSKLEARGIEVPKVRTIDELAEFLNKRKKRGAR
ncbi:energy-coupling factor transporter ATPase [Mycoplasmopsis iners]|uniref:energy-coupling factor transporter ATPase n=1 Tax=Mycoplasmopsis iners TaxID=76630 RepID=UPI00049852A6|nr:energy-coupling factor transporter ATPase [Mycoplasmopsis iners]